MPVQIWQCMKSACSILSGSQSAPHIQLLLHNYGLDYELLFRICQVSKKSSKLLLQKMWQHLYILVEQVAHRKV
jgi:hypothetical protein